MPNKPITDKESKAWKFAQEKHTGQVRKFIGASYFDAHVQKVNGIVKFYTTDEDILCAALLHDTLEDCYENKWVGYKEIKSEFGKVVADLVMELTSDNDEIEHKWDKNKGEYLINKMVKMSDDALIIKLSDRLQNISDAFTASEKFRNNYFNETSKIVEAIESNRKLSNIHKRILDDIKSKLGNIDSMFKIKKFESFDDNSKI
jgi:(p)ppGpp synthase/HD superfamily hydrolase